MDQHSSKSPAPPKKRRRRRPFWLRLTFRLLHLVSIALFMFTRFMETALREPLAWALLGPVWDGKDAGALALIVLGQQAVVFWRIFARTAHLGAASAFLARAFDAASPRPAVASESEPASVAGEAPAPEP